MFLGKLWIGVYVVRIGNRSSGLEKGSNIGQPRIKHFVYVVSEVPWHVKNMIQGNWSLESNLKDYFDMSILSDLCQCHVSTELRWTWKRPFLHWKKLLKSDEVLSFVGMSMEQARSKTHLETPRARPASNLLHRSPAWPTDPTTHRHTVPPPWSNPWVVSDLAINVRWTDNVLDCFAINTRCFAGSRLFEIIELSLDVSAQFFCSQCLVDERCIGLFCTSLISAGTRHCMQSMACPEAPSCWAALFWSALVRLRWISFSFCIPVCFEFCPVLALYFFMCVLQDLLFSTSSENRIFTNIM